MKKYLDMLNNEAKKCSKVPKALKGAINLVKRLIEYKVEHLRFVSNFDVQFDNNLAERGLRCTKSKLKLSGCFREKYKGNVFATSLTVIESLKKQKMNLTQNILKIFNNEHIIWNVS